MEDIDEMSQFSKKGGWDFFYKFNKFDGIFFYSKK